MAGSQKGAQLQHLSQTVSKDCSETILAGPVAYRGPTTLEQPIPKEQDI